MSVVRDNAEPLAIVFEDDGLVPNNILPFLVYQGAVMLDPKQPEETIENLFETNNWGGTWRNGVYDHLHYRATVHEALGVARGHARVRFGGDQGQELEIQAGDVAILPAGTGHQCIKASDDFCVIALQLIACVFSQPLHTLPNDASGAIEPIQRLQDFSNLRTGDAVMNRLPVAAGRNKVERSHFAEML